MFYIKKGYKSIFYFPKKSESGPVLVWVVGPGRTQPADLTRVSFYNIVK